MSETNEAAETVLASRWERLGAALVDGIIMMIIVAPIMFLTGAFSGIAQGIQPSALHMFGYGLLNIVIFFVINSKFLMESGQTIGKKLIGIKIVDLDGNLPNFQSKIVVRYLVYFLVGQVPFIGWLLSLVNVLIIFNDEKRCGHDLAAGTKVVSAK